MSEPSQLSPRYLTMVVAAVSLIVLTCVAFWAPVPYVTERPGPVFNTLGDFPRVDGDPMLVFGEDVKTYPTSGSLDFTTVSVTRVDSDLSLVDVATAYFEDDVAVVPKSLRYPDKQTAEDATAQSAAQLDGSKDSSQVAGLRAAGYTVTGRVRVADVSDGAPAEGLVETGDFIDAVDGTKVSTPADGVEIISALDPGDTVTLTIERDGKTREVPIVTRADEADDSVPRIGVALGTKYRFPFTITNNVGSQIGGPSAGAMFALAIYDKLTPGQLTGGRNVAGTGEISPDGVVGPIGGIRQKMAGAASEGAEIFLVPAANCAEATDGDDNGLKLVKITQLNDAISSLEALAKDPQASVPACS